MQDVDFRNAAGARGIHPFPAGLHDCISAVRWTAANKQRLGIDKVVVCGGSGGGNLALATCIKLNRDGDIKLVDGCLAWAPYISNQYSSKIETPEYLSLVRTGQLVLLARVSV